MSIANPKEMLKPFVARANGEEVEHESASHEDGARGTLTREDIALAIHRRLEGMSRREAKRLTDLVIEEMAATLGVRRVAQAARLRLVHRAHETRARGPQSAHRRAGADRSAASHNVQGVAQYEGGH